MANEKKTINIRQLLLILLMAGLAFVASPFGSSSIKEDLAQEILASIIFVAPTIILLSVIMLIAFLVGASKINPFKNRHWNYSLLIAWCVGTIVFYGCAWFYENSQEVQNDRYGYAAVGAFIWSFIIGNICTLVTVFISYSCVALHELEYFFYSVDDKEALIMTAAKAQELGFQVSRVEKDCDKHGNIYYHVTAIKNIDKIMLQEHEQSNIIRKLAKEFNISYMDGEQKSRMNL